MNVYYLHIGSAYFCPQKLIFKCQCQANSFIESLKKNLPFIDEEKKLQWERLEESVKKQLIKDLFTLLCINTNKVKNWRMLFNAPFFEEG